MDRRGVRIGPNLPFDAEARSHGNVQALHRRSADIHGQPALAVIGVIDSRGQHVGSGSDVADVETPAGSTGMPRITPMNAPGFRGISITWMPCRPVNPLRDLPFDVHGAGLREGHVDAAQLGAGGDLDLSGRGGVDGPGVVCGT